MDLQEFADPISRQIADLKLIYIENDGFSLVREAIQNMLSERAERLHNDPNYEANSVVILADSGAGKTRSVSQASHLLNLGSNAQGFRPSVPVRVPARCTQKDLGVATLRCLGWVPNARATTAEVWAQATGLMKNLQTHILHYDEIQHVSAASERDKQETADALKARLQEPGWPVCLILTGKPEFADVLNHDDQFSSRATLIQLPRLCSASDQRTAINAVRKYCQSAKIDAASNIRTREFARRLLHASNYQLGRLCRCTIAAIEIMIRRADAELSIGHFENAFRGRTSCVPALNPFFADDFINIDILRLYGRDADDDWPQQLRVST